MKTLSQDLEGGDSQTAHLAETAPGTFLGQTRQDLTDAVVGCTVTAVKGEEETGTHST